MRSVTFIETSESNPITINPDNVETVLSNGADDGHSTLLTLTSGQTVCVDGTREEVEAKLKAAD